MRHAPGRAVARIDLQVSHPRTLFGRQRKQALA
jgi:hypothetical protein